jgi:hypothetical protein
LQFFNKGSQIFGHATSPSTRRLLFRPVGSESHELSAHRYLPNISAID